MTIRFYPRLFQSLQLQSVVSVSYKLLSPAPGTHIIQEFRRLVPACYEQMIPGTGAGHIE